jgi:hypothetical protein
MQRTAVRLIVFRGGTVLLIQGRNHSRKADWEVLTQKKSSHKKQISIELGATGKTITEIITDLVQSDLLLNSIRRNHGGLCSLRLHRAQGVRQSIT